MGVGALSAVPAGPLQALFDVLLTRLPLEAGRTITLERAARHRDAHTAMLTGQGRAQVLLLALISRIALGAHAPVLVQRL